LGKIIAVTGAAGYVGQLLLAQLERQGWVERIVAIDVKPVPANGRVVSYCLDVRDSAILRAIFAEHDITHLIHAAFVITPLPDMTADQMYSINVEGSQSVIACAIHHGVEQIVFLSSVAVYGYRAGHPAKVSEDGAQRPNMVYGRHKVEVEKFIRQQGEEYVNSHVAIIRPAAIIGPHGKTGSHLRALTAQPAFIVANGGRALTQALHEDDAISLVVKVVEQNSFGTFNAAPNDYASWAEIARISKLPVLSAPRGVLNFITRFNKSLPALRGFSTEVVDLFSESLVVDNSQARKQIGWSPRYTTCEAFEQFF
jgi:UDP-glucose 4-epimerase